MSPRALFITLYAAFLGLLFYAVADTMATDKSAPGSLSISPSNRDATGEPAWLPLAQRINSKHKGRKGYVALLGDSITFTDAFWTPLEFTEPEQYLPKDDGLPLTPAGKKWKDVILGLRGKGLEHCNGSGWQVGHILRTIDALMKREQPEIAIIMVGTNDIGSGAVPEAYESQLERIVEKCIEYKCIPVLTTIPPRRDRDEAVKEANKIIRGIAKRKKLAVIDFHAEMSRRQPAERMYETLMHKDGIHPSGGKTNLFTEENMSVSGYALRNWLTFRMYREIYFRVLHPQEVRAMTRE